MKLIALSVTLLVSTLYVAQGRIISDVFNDFENPEYGDYWEGDILTDGQTMEDLQNVNPLNAVWDRRKRWPGGDLYYTIREDYTEDQLERISAAITDLVNKVKVDGKHCIRILPRTTQRNYVYIVDQGGCSSYLGMIGGAQRLNLAPGCFRHGTIMHEFLHAFGFHHEQKRSDRDDFVTINWNNIQSGKERNFYKLVLNVTVDLLGTSYDYSSVMHYGAYSFAKDRTKPTITPHDSDAEIGQRVKLSALDIERVQIFYECLKPENSKYFKHLAKESLGSRLTGVRH